MPSSRREFLHQSASLAAGTLLPAQAVPAEVAGASLQPKTTSAADTLSVALIGCNNMGWANLSSMLKHPGVRCVGLCDVDQTVLAKRAADLEKLAPSSPTNPKPALYSDFRKVLENKMIDAVIVGTPDHWHCLPTVMACQAGKDVYVEKPMANSIEECNLMVAAARKYGRIVQVGQWQRSGNHWREAIEFVQSGKLGNIRLVKTWAYMTYGRKFDPKPDAPVPAGVDYDMWLGPAPKRPFNEARFHGSFRYFWDYAGGLMTDWGAHMIDMGLWGIKQSAPKSVVAMGGRFGYPNHAGDTPDTMQVLYDFGNVTLQWEQGLGLGQAPFGRDAGVAFIGNNGTLVADRDGWNLFPEADDDQFMTPGLPRQPRYGNDLDRHTLNFLECVRSRKQPNASAEVGRNVALHAQLGNISYRLGQKLIWNEATQSVVDNPKANELVRAHYRSPWTLPTV